MAARANLSIGSKLTAEFRAATGGSDVRPRYVQCQVLDETVEFLAKGAPTADFAADLATVRSTALSGKATFVLLHLDGVNAATGDWLMVAYVPSGTKVRSKMLMASAREDIKQHLGRQHFRGELHLSEASELDIASVNAVVHKILGDAPLTEAEIQAKAEAMDVNTERGSGGVVNFACSDALRDKLAAFNGGAGCNFLEVHVTADEVLELSCAETVSDGAALAPRVHLKEPRYFFLRRTCRGEPKVYFVFSCPETSKIKSRMLYATCKAKLLEQAGAIGIEVQKILEARSAGEVDEQLQEDAAAPDAKEAAALAQPAYVKPKGPGRGRRRKPKNMFKKP